MDYFDDVAAVDFVGTLLAVVGIDSDHHHTAVAGFHTAVVGGFGMMAVVVRIDYYCCYDAVALGDEIVETQQQDRRRRRQRG